MGSIEIFRRGGRYEHCAVLYWPEDRKSPDYIIVQDSLGRELICHRAMGAWREISPMDIIMHLRTLDRLVKSAAVEHAEPSK